jgi:radical SAM superfamily enzyme YgiQ (UPF0313 family)
MKVCLLTCSAPFLIDEMVFPPLGLMTVGAALRVQGHDVTIADDPEAGMRWGITNYFAMGPTTPQYADAVSMLRRIKRRDKDNRVVIGGPHATANAMECVFDGFDVVVLGDGENITAETFRTAGVVELARRPLDRYPIADRSLVEDIRAYRYEIGGRLATTIVTSRGCPYRCGFCANTERQVRFYGVDRIEREIVYLKERWGYNALMLFDDVFILNRERALQICAVLKRHGIVWRCFVRGDLVVRHGQGLVDVMAESGCAEVAIGIESGSERILKIIHKGERLESILSAIGMLRQAGIRVKGLFIVGLPGEDHTSIGQTRQFVEEVALDDADFTVYQPYRGSPIWNDRDKYDIHWDDVPADQRFYKGRPGQYQCAVSTSGLTAEEILRARDSLERSFRNGHS